VVKRTALVVIGALVMMLVSTTVAMAGWTPEFDRGAFPHSGTQIAIFAVVVVLLLVGGIALWYYSHPRKRDANKSADKGPDEDS
jgi:drug/metabolite transporter (DMT)-like permease